MAISTGGRFQLLIWQAQKYCTGKGSKNNDIFSGMVFGTDATDLKLEDIQIHDFGQVGEVTITKDDTLFLKGKGNEKDIGKFWLLTLQILRKFEVWVFTAQKII